MRGLLPARPVRPHIEVEMIVVSLVVSGAEHHIEEATSAISQGAQESFPAPIASCPIALHRDLLSVGKDEARNIDGVGASMLAAPPTSPMIDVPAGIGAEMRHPHDLLSEMLPRGGKQDVPLEQGPGHRQRAC